MYLQIAYAICKTKNQFKNTVGRLPTTRDTHASETRIEAKLTLDEDALWPTQLSVLLDFAGGETNSPVHSHLVR